MSLSWKFGINDTQEVEGPNNSGIANFTDDRTGGLVREVLQNSIDAKACDDEPVEVSFRVQELPIDDLDLDGLKSALVASCESNAIDDRHKQQFERGIRALKKAMSAGSLSALRITDSATTGAPDEKGQRDKWHSLTKTVGLSAKDMRDSGGSFGIGKHAAFAATDLRTVIYSTAYQNGTDSPLRRRFTGKSILVSHEVSGKAFRASGWLEDDGSALCDGDVPAYFQLESPGTQINILGFREPEMEWQDKAKESLVKHFFHALANDRLRVHIGDSNIDSKSLDEVAADMKDEDIRRLIDVSRSEVVDHTDIDGIGRVNLRISVDQQGEHAGKTVALVRDAGMMITSQLGNMKITPSQRMISIPRHWLGFTAIVECLSHGDRSLLREAEGPRHDKVSSDNADSLERKEVGRALRELGNWVKEAITRLAEPPPPSESNNAEELADVLELPGGGAVAGNGKGGIRWKITEPRQSSKAPRGLSTPGRKGRRTTIDVPGGDGRRPGKGEKGKKRPTRTGTTSVPVQVSFSDLRRLPAWHVQWPEHAVRFAFNVPTGPMKHIRLYAIGEDGKDTQIPLERAYIGPRRIPVKGGEIVEIPGKFVTRDRVEIEMKAIRPIADRRLVIKCSSERKAGKK